MNGLASQLLDEFGHIVAGGSGDAANMQRIHTALKERGILVPYFNAYSGLPPEGVLRFAVFANHSAAQIDRLLEELRALQ